MKQVKFNEEQSKAVARLLDKQRQFLIGEVEKLINDFEKVCKEDIAIVDNAYLLGEIEHLKIDLKTLLKKQETLEEHEKHCDFCKGMKELSEVKLKNQRR